MVFWNIFIIIIIYHTFLCWSVQFNLDKRFVWQRIMQNIRAKKHGGNVIYFTTGNDTGRNVIRCPSHYCDKLITSRRVRNSKGKFSSRYESAGCEHERVYPRSLRLDNTPLACYNGGPTCITTAPRNVPKRCNKIASTPRSTDLRSYS